MDGLEGGSAGSISQAETFRSPRAAPQSSSPRWEAPRTGAPIDYGNSDFIHCSSRYWYGDI